MANYTYDELVNILEIQVANVPTYKTELGATDAEITALSKELDNMRAARDYAELADTNKKTAFAIKDQLKNGEAGSVLPPYPPISAGNLPDPSRGGGMEAVITTRNRRWLNSPDCTPEIATACALKRAAPTSPAPGSVQPTAEVDPAQAGYLSTVVVKNRGEADMFEVFARVSGTTQWTSLGRFSKRSADVTWPNGTGQPLIVEFRVQLRKNDEVYGQFSQIATVTLNP
jgi:hypothetical protein